MAEKILLVRNDKLGDFMLAWPAYRLLKQNYPDAQVHALVPAYTRPMAEQCPWIDQVIIDPGEHAGPVQMARLFRKQGYTRAVCLFSSFRVAMGIKLAGIPHRYAPATKVFQFLFNHRITQRRSQSIKPEWQYNTDLIVAMLRDMAKPVDEACLHAPYLQFDQAELAQTRTQFFAETGLSSQKPLVLMHTGSGGSASNLSAAQYAELANAIMQQHDCQIVLSIGPGELEKAAAVYAGAPKAIMWQSQGGLLSFAKVIALADLFIAGSTGPLHIAGALDVPTVGFYPRVAVMSALRWQTLNAENKRLAFWPEEPAEGVDMSHIDLSAAAQQILARGWCTPKQEAALL